MNRDHHEALVASQDPTSANASENSFAHGEDNLNRLSQESDYPKTKVSMIEQPNKREEMTSASREIPLSSGTLYPKHNTVSDCCTSLGTEQTLAIITGGSRGIGKACVQTFARNGSRVLFTYCSDASTAKEVVRTINSANAAGVVSCCHLDQGCFSSVRRFAREVDVWREGRSVNYLVNNAALGSATVESYEAVPTGKLEGSDATFSNAQDDKGLEDLRRAEEDVALMRVNALGPMWVTEALLPAMKSAQHTEIQLPHQTKRTALFIGSVGGGSQSVFPGFRAADAMSKAALAYACKHFAARSRTEIRRLQGDDCDAASGIDFVCLCPGATLTDMFRASTLDGMSSDHERARFASALPQGKLIKPEEVAETVHWLCTCHAAGIFHGAILDGSAGLAVRPGSLTEYKFTL